MNRDALKDKYGSLFESVSAVLFEADPLEIGFESNTDEYEPEVGTILPRLHDAESESDVHTILHEEFLRWFDEECVGPKESYASLAAKIWWLWCEFSSSQGSSDGLPSVQ